MSNENIKPIRQFKVYHNDEVSEYTMPKANYFARFRLELDDLIFYLKSISGDRYEDSYHAFECLEDLGYWSLVRSSEVFQMTDELEAKIRAQFDYLQNSFDYKTNDLLIWGDLKNEKSTKFKVKVIEKLVDGEQDLYRIEIIKSGATMMVSRFELDFWNAAGSSLPSDLLVECVDWDGDRFWLKKLSDFKEMMAAQNFEIDFRASTDEISQKQDELLKQIQKFFTLRPGAHEQRGLGIGLLSCGDGRFEDSAVVLALAVQALGHSFGLKARLWGFQRDGKMNASFTLFFKNFDGSSLRSWSELLIENTNYKPMQRPLSEVLRKVIASGPFGKAEVLPILTKTLHIDFSEGESIEKK